MTILLMANIGNSDLELPEALLPKDGAVWTVRRRGEYIFQHLDQLVPRIRLPLLGPTLRWLYDNQPVDELGLTVILYASDQLQGVTPEDDRQKDTKPIADVIAAILTRRDGGVALGVKSFTGIAKKHVRVHAIEGNPADYSNMLAFYTQDLPRRAAYLKDDTQVYLEISGGTPAMTSMLILAAVEVFGARAHTLYVDRGASQPYEVSVASELFARRTRDTLLGQVSLNAYAVAHHTLDASGVLIHSDEAQRALISALLDYADRRLAFDFDQARAALVRARQLTTGNNQAYVKSWLTQLEAPDVAVNLSELLHSMKIKHRFGDYADFVQRIFRFQEAAFRYMAEQMGMRYRDANRDEYVDADWVQGVPGLTDFLNRYRHPVTGYPMPVECARASLNRVSLGAIVDFFVQTDGAWLHWLEVAKTLHGLSKVAELRNRGLSGHGFRGISRANVEDAYGASIEELFVQLNRAYSAIFNRQPGDSPYDMVNRLLHELIVPNAPKAAG